MNHAYDRGRWMDGWTEGNREGQCVVVYYKYIYKITDRLAFLDSSLF